MPPSPNIQTRPEQPYVDKRAVMPMADFDREIPAMTAQVAEWLACKGLAPSGKPFLIYHVIDMPQRMDVALGFPVASALAGEGGITRQALPAGRYAVLAYTGVENGIAANKTLIDWIAAHGEQAVSHESENGTVFEARYETYLTDAKAQPDPAQWEIEIAIKLRD